MKKDCLLITTNDKRNLFTHKKHLPQMVEFSKIIGAELSFVKAENPDILDLEQLAPAICNTSCSSNASYETIKCFSKKRLKNTHQIRQHIREEFLSGKTVMLQEIANKFKKMNLTNACFCNHISKIRLELIKEGHQIEKLGGGKYRCAKK